MSRFATACRWFLVALSLGLVPGCSAGGLFRSGSLLPGFEPKVKRATPENPVVRTLGLWQPAEGPGLDGNQCRGFAGQVFFFTNDFPEPVAVDGDVRIYIFDDQGTREEQIKPIHQFDFKAGAWGTHMRQAQWGPGYQIFIPYTRAGNHEARCALRLRLTPAEGPAIESEMVYVHLKGFTPEERARLAARQANESAQGKPQTVDEAAEAIRQAAGDQGLRRRGFDTIAIQTPDGRYHSLPAEQPTSAAPAVAEAVAPSTSHPGEPSVWKDPAYMRRLPARVANEGRELRRLPADAAQLLTPGQRSAEHPILQDMPTSAAHPLQTSSHPLVGTTPDDGSVRSVRVFDLHGEPGRTEGERDDAFARHVRGGTSGTSHPLAQP